MRNTMKRISPTRQIVRNHIDLYKAVSGMPDIHTNPEIYPDTIKQIELKANSLVDANPYWWEDCQKPELTGSGLERLANAICIVNSLLDCETEGMEPFFN
jgi:hypothetical protein